MRFSFAPREYFVTESILFFKTCNWVAILRRYIFCLSAIVYSVERDGEVSTEWVQRVNTNVYWCETKCQSNP